MDKKKMLAVLAFIPLLLLLIPPVHAHCPLCTAAIATGAVTAKYYGIGENIIGLFIGAFAVSTGLMVGRRIRKKRIRLQLPLIVLLSFVLTVVPLMAVGTESAYLPLLLAGEAGTALNRVYWISKILLGGAIGGAITLGAFWLHVKAKASSGRVFIPFQGIVLTLALLAAGGVGLYMTIGA